MKALVKKEAAPGIWLDDVPEPKGGAQNDHDAAATYLGEALAEALDELVGVPGDELRRKRRARFRSLGVYA